MERLQSGLPLSPRCVSDGTTARNGPEEGICGTNLALQHSRTAMVISLGEERLTAAGLLPYTGQNFAQYHVV